MHVSDWKGEAGVDDKPQNKYRCRSHSLGERPREGADGPEHHGHSQDTSERKQIERKES